MTDSLEALLSRLRGDNSLFLSGEEATRQGVILPILGRLGWERDDVREVVPEFSVGGGRVDYCLKVGEKKAVFIEVKRTNQELEQHQEQLLEYAFRDGVELALLTNGLLWWFYLPLEKGSWDQRKFFTIDIQQQEVESADKHFKDFLARDSIADGSAVKRAQLVLAGKEKARIITETIPKAWYRICQEPDEILLELFAEKVESICGHRPDFQCLAEHLAGEVRRADEPSTVPQMQALRPMSPRIAASPERAGNYTNTRPVSFSFRNDRRRVSTYKEILIGLVQALHKVHSSDFERILTLRGRKRMYFARDYKGMTAPQEIPGLGIYAETNLSANNIMSLCHDVLSLFGHPHEDLQVEFENR